MSVANDYFLFYHKSLKLLSASSKTLPLGHFIAGLPFFIYGSYAATAAFPRCFHDSQPLSNKAQKNSNRKRRNSFWTFASDVV